MKAHSNKSKNQTSKLNDNKKSSEVFDDIINDYNNIQKKEDDKINIFNPPKIIYLI